MPACAKQQKIYELRVLRASQVEEAKYLREREIHHTTLSEQIGLREKGREDGIEKQDL